MEVKVNYVVVGFFTLATIIAGFLIVFLLSVEKTPSHNLAPLKIYVPGSVSGLSKASKILFNGIPVGQITDLALDKTDPNRVVLTAMVNDETPITRSTQANIILQGLTGVGMIELHGSSLKEPRLLQLAQKNGSVASLIADSGSVNNLINAAQKILGQAENVTQTIKNLVQNVSTPLEESVKNVHTLTDTLAKNSGNFQKITDQTQQLLSNLNAAAKDVDSVIAKLNQQFETTNRKSLLVQAHNSFKSIENAANNISKKVGHLSDSMQHFSTDSFSDIKFIVGQAEHTLARIEQDLQDLKRSPSGLLWGGGIQTVPNYRGGR